LNFKAGVTIRDVFKMWKALMGGGISQLHKKEACERFFDF
jgi:hypothetical protein